MLFLSSFCNRFVSFVRDIWERRIPLHRHPTADPSGPEEFFCQLEQLAQQTALPWWKRPWSRTSVRAAALVGLTGLSAAGALLFSTCTLCYAVTPAGSPPLAFVRAEDSYARAVCQVEEQVSDILHTNYAYPADTQVALTIAPKTSLQTSAQLTESLMDTVEQVQEAYTLTVDGISAGVCATLEDAQEALALAKASYLSEQTCSVNITSAVSISTEYIPTEADILTPEELAGVLLEPPADGSSAPLLGVETVETVTYSRPIPSPMEEQEDTSLILGQRETVQQGIEGLEEVTDRVTYRCGTEVSRETITSAILSEPTPTVVSVGTAQGVDAARGRFLWPVTGRITSPFGYRYIFGSNSFHSGLDIANSSGTPIAAAADGTVLFSGTKGSYGNLIRVDHGNGFITCYAHCSQLLVQAGEQVSQGQTIGLVGSTGRSTGPHLHFEVRWQEEPIDPQLCLP